MTAEEIIERLIDEDKITAKEAIVLIKAICKEFAPQLFPPYRDTVPQPPVTVMYGVSTSPNFYDDRFTRGVQDGDVTTITNIKEIKTT